MSKFDDIVRGIANQDLPSNKLYDVADELIAGIERLTAENGDMKERLAAALDALGRTSARLGADNERLTKELAEIKIVYGAYLAADVLDERKHQAVNSEERK